MQTIGNARDRERDSQFVCISVCIQNQFIHTNA